MASRGSFAREKLQDALLGFVVGAFNGYLLVGSLWYFLHEANYPYPQLILPPEPGKMLGDTALTLLKYAPPRWLIAPPAVYFAVIFSFLFVIVVFV